MSAVRLAAAVGSVAPDEEGDDGDLGLALLLDPDSTALRQEIEAALGRAAGWEVEFVYLQESVLFERFVVARDGVLLVERHPGDWAERASISCSPPRRRSSSPPIG